LNNFVRNFGDTLIAASVQWVTYLALEPYVRRFWPDGILGWARLLSGHVRDPRVGRDVLTGCVVATALGVLQALMDYASPMIGLRTDQPSLFVNINALGGVAPTLGIIADQMVGGAFAAMLIGLGYVLLRLALRRTDLAIAATVVLLALAQSPQVLSTVGTWWVKALFQAAIVGVFTTLIVRFGILVTATALTVGNTISGIPLTTSFGHWTATSSNLLLTCIVGLTCFGFWAARAGQPLFGNFGDDLKP
jgi:hypothetical protein